MGQNGGGMVAYGQDDTVEEDVVEGEEGDDATVETDEGPGDAGDAEAGSEAATTEEKEEDEEEEKPLKPSPDADTHILFTKPTVMEFPAGSSVKFLVGFTNKGDKDFVVETMEASFRYPQDFSFYIQNFTAAKYDRVVEPSRQATFEYLFTPSDSFNARPFGLTINLNYKDLEGNIFQDAVFNDTVNIVEADEGLDGETFFLYVFLVAVVVLMLLGAQQVASSWGKKKRSTPRAPVVEMGTQNKGDVDFDWLPKETLQELNRSPGRSPKSNKSPRQRRSKRSTGSVDE